MPNSTTTDVVNSCPECAFFKRLGSLFVCEHPENKEKHFTGKIIDPPVRKIIPDACPLREEDLVIRYTLGQKFS